MSTGTTRAGFFPKQVLGSSILKRDFYEAGLESGRALGANVIGECVVDPTLVGLGIQVAGTINNRRLTVTGTNLPALDNLGNAYNEMGNSSTLRTESDGSRTITLSSPDWFEDLPFQNDDGTTYNVYLHHIEFPVDVKVGTTGGRGYSRMLAACGVVVNPDSVSNTGTELQFVVLSGLTALGVQPWLTSNAQNNDWSYDCVVWLDTDIAGVEIQADDPDTAIAFNAKLTKRTGQPDWIITLAGIGDGYLGQQVFDTDASHYKIAVLGPVITTTDFDNNDAYVRVGHTQSATGGDTTSTAGQLVINTVASVLAAAAAVPNALLYKGWISKPTVAVTATTVTVTTVGEAFVTGRIVPTPTSLALPPLSGSASAPVWLYYDSAEDEWVITSDENEAISDPALILTQFMMDGDEEFITSSMADIGRNTRQFNVAATYTVSGAVAHRANFSTLNEALGFAEIYRAGVSGTDDFNVDIEILGDTVISAPMSDVWELKNVTIRGRANPDRNLVTDTTGSRIFFDSEFGAFEIGPLRTLNRWTFRNVEIIGTNDDHTDAKSSFIRVTETVSGAYGIDTLNFFNVTFRGLGLASDPGRVVHLIAVEGGYASNITFDGCVLETHASIVYNAATADEGLANIFIRNCVVSTERGINSYGTVSTPYGAVVDMVLAGSGVAASRNWTIKDSEFQITGYLVHAYRIHGVTISGNQVDVSGGDGVGPACAIRLGDRTQTSELSKVFIDHNYIECYSPVGAAVVDLCSPGTISSGVRQFAGIMVDHNVILGASLMIGVRLHGGTGFVKGVMIDHNVIESVTIAVSAASTLQSHVHSNVIAAIEHAVSMTGSSAASSKYASFNVLGNYVEMRGTDAVVAFNYGVTSPFDTFQFIGNTIDMTNMTFPGTATAWNFQGLAGGEATLNTIAGNTVVGGVVETAALIEEGVTGNIYFGNRFAFCDVEMNTGSNIFMGNDMFGEITVVEWNSSLIISNQFRMTNGAGSAWSIEGSSLVGNRIDNNGQSLSISGEFIQSTGNKFLDISDLTFTTVDGSSFIGDQFRADDQVTFSNVDRLAIVGSEIGVPTTGTVVIDGGFGITSVGSWIWRAISLTNDPESSVFVANTLSTAQSWASDSFVVTGNRLNGFTLTGSSIDTAVVANAVTGGTVANTGTDNQVANNVDLS